MKIAYVINSVEGGGAALPVPAITSVMRAAGHDVTVLALTRRDGRAIGPMRKAGLDVRVREGSRTDHIRALTWLDHTIAELRPDVIWTSLTRATLLGQIVGWRRQLPVVSWQHSARLKPANARLLRLFRNRSRLWIADSTCVEQETRAKLRVASDRLVCWPIFRADETRSTAKPWTRGQTIRIGTLGRLHPVKGFDTLCEAVACLKIQADLPPFIVHIGGEGAERTRLQERITREKLPIVLDGYIEKTDEFLSGLHLYVQPSHWEGLCLAAHEAMLAGLPIVASDAGEIPFTVTKACGRIVPPKDGTALAAALGDLLRQPENLATMGQNARHRVLDRFSADAFDRRGREILLRVEAGQ
ncbi:lipopolysaccharide glycosyl transferase [Neoasaia chiangmaiensis NBRC 101099]|uniref:Glycosyltransferase n=1 Tax=Neoasaia chiangmaiensis TaxID=320497 RepID=A0A1U9KTM2_9PROT|nr:glycosyltransferase family 4 protein [Neoasaia chiangmaiensis]AQS89020.1 glycosyltransferase [Neoasaia chiangmaiensis]GBR40118.1 lipopolysaccharide glycosyl transferase [Neoasaia chiangmaiensis NBRC 101099]GEN14048.1 LPS glycosyltransferase [Neoasaia chiangmaiensis]